MRRLLPLFLLAGIALAAPPMNRAAFLLKHSSAVIAVQAGSSGVLAYDPDGGGIVALSITGPERSLKVPGNSKLRSPVITPEGRVLAVQLDFDRCQVAVWDVGAGQKVTALRGDFRRVFGCDSEGGEFIFGAQFTPGGRFLLTQDVGSLRRWDARTGKLLKTLPGQFFSLSGSPDGRSVVTIGEGRRVAVWAADLSRRLKVLPQQPADCYRGPGAWPGEIVWSPDSTKLAFSCDREVRVWNVAAGGLRGFRRDQKVDSPEAPTFSPDGRFVVSNEDQFGVAVWKTGDGQRVTRLRLDRPGAQVTDVKVAPDNVVYAALSSGTVLRRDLARPEVALAPWPLFEKKPNRADVWLTLAISQQRDRLAAASGDGRLKVYALPGK